MKRTLLYTVIFFLSLSLFFFAATLATLDFEEGDLTDWTDTYTSNAVIDAHGDAARSGSYGSRHFADSPPPTDRRARGFYTHGSGVGEYYCLFYLNIDDWTMADGDEHRLWRCDADSGTAWNLRFALLRDGASYELDPTGGFFGDSHPINKATWNKIEIYVKRETGDGNDDGIVRIWLNDVLKWENTAETDNHDTLWKEWLIGFDAATDAGTEGYLYLDDISIQDTMPANGETYIPRVIVIKDGEER